MKHLNEEALSLHYYGESPPGAAVERHLGECEACREEYHKLQRVLNSVDSFPVPERAADYEQRLWQRLEPAVRGSRGWPAWRPSRRVWALAGVAASLVAAFFAGRALREATTASPSPATERILVVALDEHLERSRLVLVELANTATGQARDISYEQGKAQDLLGANRLYRQTAASAGDAGAAEILEDLERVLLEITHTPPKASAAEVEELRRDIEDREILMKVRSFGSRLREQEEEDRL